MLRFSEIIIGPLNQRPVCTGNKRGLCFHILFLCCLLSVCNVFTTPRAGHQSRPLPLVFICIWFSISLFPLFIFWLHSISRKSLFLMTGSYQDNVLLLTVILRMVLLKMRSQTVMQLSSSRINRIALCNSLLLLQCVRWGRCLYCSKVRDLGPVTNE